MQKSNRKFIEDYQFGESVDSYPSVVGDDPDAVYPKDKCIHHLFEDQVRNKPDHIAVVINENFITYRQLEEKSNQFAHFLITKGVRPETLVGICLDRSLEIIIAMLSILKAGGAYVPIDPDYPKERIAFQLTDSGCPFLITHSMLRPKLPETGTALLCYDEVLPEIEKYDIVPVDSTAQPNNLAYVIYTSGSTGQPKGVMIEHGNVVRLLFNDKFQFDFNEKDVWSIFHSFCFDFSVWEMYGALLFGGKAVIVPKEKTRDPDAFADILIRDKVTVINQTPSAFYNLIPRLLELSRESFCLRYVIFGGEKLNPGKLEAVKNKFSDIKFINMYGITETTVHVTYKEITKEDIARGFSNIGKPIPTLKVYIFGPDMQLQPIGIEGELCVSGDGVARGYLNRDELTKEKFVPNPLNPQERIYRSGDLARVRENGDIEYFGRMDNQVQLRGYRIELGEIETALIQLEEIEDGVVTCDEGPKGEARIIAYIVTAGKNVSNDILRTNLTKRLPDYMLPTFFIRIERLPLTGNGKLDPSQLPRPDIENVTLNPYTAPENETEQALSKIWGQILEIDSRKIGRQYNFFEIGGHSLAAAIIAQRMRDHFKKAVTIEHIYEHPNLSDLSRSILELDAIVDHSSGEVEENTVCRERMLPLTSAQIICWIVDFVFKTKYSNVCEMYHIKGSFDLSCFQEALDKVARSHDSLWYSFSKKKPMISAAKPTQCKLELIDMPDEIKRENEDQLKVLISDILHHPFDISQPPFFRMAVVKKEDQPHLLLVSFPHIISDLASLNAFVTEIFDTYKSLQEGCLTPHQLRKTTAREIIQKEIDYLKSERCLKDIEFWKEKLEDQKVLKFSHDLILPLGRSSGTKLLAKIELNDAIIKNLQRISAQSSTSIQLIIQALIQATLRTLTGQDDITTAMVCDIRGLYPYPPVTHMNSTVIAVRSTFSATTNYLELISHIKWFLVEALNHVQLPSSMLFATPTFIRKELKKRPFIFLANKLFTKIRLWRYRKAKINQDNFRALALYIFAMVAVFLNVRRKNKSLRSTYPIAFNVLPDFFEDKVLWSSDSLEVSKLRDRELTMDPKVFEDRSRYEDAILLNIDLLRDHNNTAFLYLWGGRFNAKAFARIEKIIFRHLERMVENPGNTILKDV